MTTLPHARGVSMTTVWRRLPEEIAVASHIIRVGLVALLFVIGGCGANGEQEAGSAAGEDSGVGDGGVAPDTAQFDLDVVNVVEDGGQDPTLAVTDNPGVLLAWG